MKYRPRIYFLFNWFFILFTFLYSEETNASGLIHGENDTIIIKRGTVFKLDGKMIIPKQDTMLILPDSVVRKNPSLKSAYDYNRIKKTTEKNHLLGEVSGLVFASHRIPEIGKNEEVVKRAVIFSEHNGKTIRKISVRHFDVFGTNLNDTSIYNANGLENILNSIHIDTRSWVVKKNILFSEGDALDPPLLAENERFIRNLSYIEDARFLVVTDSLNPEVVDLVLLVKDVFPWAASVSIRSIEESSFGAWNNNVLGIGHRLDFGITYRTDEAPAVLFRNFGYSVSNIAGSLINGNIYYKYGNDFENSGISLIRSLIPGKNKYIYGFALNRYSQSNQMIFSDTIFDARIGSTEWLANIGQVFHTTGKKSSSENSPMVILQTTYQTRIINYLPEELTNRSISFYNYQRYLLSLSCTKPNIITGNYFEGFGKTEDIAYGYLYKVVGGYETGDQGNRFYGDLNLIRVSYLKNRGFLNTVLDFGGYLNKGEFQQGILNINSTYVSPLRVFGMFHQRDILNVQYIKGYNRLENENLILNGESGFSQFGSDQLKGSERMTISIGSQLYTPWYLLGFRMNMMGYMEFGILNTNRKSIIESTLYPGLGLGIMLKNENLAFDAFQISFIYYPNNPESEYFNVFSGKFNKFRFPDLYNYSVRDVKYR